MSDIVERLLDQDSDWIYTERAESAAEIERLRAELAEARAKAFEEAAKLAEDRTRNYSPGTFNGLRDNIAQAIRAMIDKG